MSNLPINAFHRLRAGAAAAAVALLAAACAPAGAAAPTVAAVVNGQEIPVSELSETYDSVRQNPQVSQQLQGDNSGQFASQLQAELLTGLIHSRLLAEAAEERGISVTEEDVQQQRDEIVQQVGGEQAFSQLLEQNNLSEEQVAQQLRDRALREAVGQELAAGQEVSRQALRDAYQQQIVGGDPRASHILVDTEEQAENILTRLKAGADFNELARKESQDPTAERNGGDLGRISRGQTVPEFEEALFNADPGELVGPVQTQFGWHIIKRHEPPPLEEVEDRLREQVRQEQGTALVRQFLVRRAQDADVRVNPRFGQWDAEAGRVVPGDPLDPPGATSSTGPLPPGAGSGGQQGAGQAGPRGQGAGQQGAGQQGTGTQGTGTQGTGQSGQAGQGGQGSGASGS